MSDHGNIIEIKTADEFNKAIASGEPAVVDFFAEWCGPCKAISPKLVQYSKDYTTAKFYKIDVDELMDVAQKHKVSAMPTFVLFKGGEEVDRVTGAVPPAIEAAVKKLVA